MSYTLIYLYNKNKRYIYVYNKYCKNAIFISCVNVYIVYMYGMCIYI